MIYENVKKVRDEIAKAAVQSGRRPEDVILVAATKLNSAEKVREAVAAGIDVAGENRVQEFLEKQQLNAYEGVPIHFIGHLQRNKVKYIVGAVDMIESVSSKELAYEISKQAQKKEITQEILLEVNIGNEDSKSGFSADELFDAVAEVAKFEAIRIKGLMAIPPAITPTGEKGYYFAQMYKLFVDIKAKKYDNVNMDYLSMGMSADYTAAILEGANMVRVGTGIFGPRPYMV